MRWSPIPNQEPWFTTTDRQGLLDGCQHTLDKVQTQFFKEKTLYFYQVHYLSSQLQKTKLKLTECQGMCDVYSIRFNDAKSFAIDQQYGLIVGAIVVYICFLIDFQYAAHYAQKNNVKQIGLAKIFLPTIICFIQVQLRKADKNSKLAAILSVLKRPSSPNKSQSKSSLTRKQKKRPKPFSPVSVINKSSDEISLHSANVRFCKKKQDPKAQTFTTNAIVHSANNLCAIQICKTPTNIGKNNEHFDMQSNKV